MSAKAATKIAPGYRVGHLTVESDTGERKNGYIVWNCVCDCGNTIQLDKRTIQRGTITDCGCITKIRPGQRDAAGQRFGMLTAQYCTGKKDKNGGYYWHCTCDCGGEVDASLHQLQAGYRKSCGCLAHPALKDFIGKRFGRLVVIGYAGKEKGMHRWTCRCDCGTETVVGQSSLQSGKTKSCGCYKAEAARENLKLVDGTSVRMLERSGERTYSSNTSGYTGVYPQKKNRPLGLADCFQRKNLLSWRLRPDTGRGEGTAAGRGNVRGLPYVVLRGTSVRACSGFRGKGRGKGGKIIDRGSNHAASCKNADHIYHFSICGGYFSSPAYCREWR